MNLPLGRLYRLVPRGGPGLSCDADGVALGGVPLARVWSAAGRRQSEVRPLGEFGEILRLAYGAQSLEVVRRCYRGLQRAAAQLDAEDLARASLEAVTTGFPDLASPAMAKLARFTELQKGGDDWEDQPRVPAGEHGGGQWTIGGGGAPAMAGGVG